MTDEKHNVIVIYDHHERGIVRYGKQYLVVYGVDGREHPISEVRQQLWKPFLENVFKRGDCFLAVYEKFKDTEYVASIQAIPADWQKPISELGMKAAVQSVNTDLRAKALELAMELIKAPSFNPLEGFNLYKLADYCLNYIMDKCNEENTEASE